MSLDRAAATSAIIDRDGECRWLCGHLVALADRSLDHVVPRSKGGRDALGNLKLAHQRCNSARGDAEAMTTDERIALQAREG